jgi:hypothetical protein
MLQVRNLCLSAALCGVVFAVHPAHAGLVSYTDPGSFAAATTGLSDVGFGGIAPAGGFVDFSIPPGYTDAGTNTVFTFPTAPGSDINVTSATYYSTTFPGSPVFPADVLDAAANVPAGTPESVTLPASETAFGFTFTTFDGAPITVTLSNGDSFVDSATPAFGTFAFLGFTDTTPFSSLTITDAASNGVLLSDVKFGSSAIPEPASVVLLGVSSLLLAGRRRRRA